MRFSGVYYNDPTIDAQLTIRDGYISFNDREDTWRYKIDTSNPQYYTGTDNSGGKYEKLYYSGEFFRDWTIIGNGTYREKHVVIQTWNRREFFIDGVQEVKLSGKGRHKYYEHASSMQSTIIVMDDYSAAQLSALFDQVKEISGVKIWR